MIGEREGERRDGWQMCGREKKGSGRGTTRGSKVKERAMLSLSFLLSVFLIMKDKMEPNKRRSDPIRRRALQNALLLR